MISSNVIFVYGGFTKKTLEDPSFEDAIIKTCEDIDIDREEQCKCSAQSNALVRHTSDGGKSMLYFDSNGVKSFYQYQSIVVVETKFTDEIKRNYVIYICV